MIINILRGLLPLVTASAAACSEAALDSDFRGSVEGDQVWAQPSWIRSMSELWFEDREKHAPKDATASCLAVLGEIMKLAPDTRSIRSSRVAFTKCFSGSILFMLVENECSCYEVWTDTVAMKSLHVAGCRLQPTRPHCQSRARDAQICPASAQAGLLHLLPFIASAIVLLVLLALL